ncbi:hypothetical protein [Lysinibacillus sphaericus]|uniref:Uncharacterized protein n=1 Tax=Lysinibacillus sphaericus OT4b.31 TaxID=1285586 RepID=R7Z8W0_LYSSH|nr:hypothetical protein [Lysinibacillus sphaericus]EON70401.1 hypothetical protein H131_21857 [Lysinibacillus sphaericus OT4b.31]
MASTIKEQQASVEQVKQVITDSIKHEILMYVGPTVKGLQRFSSFVGGYPKHFKEHLEQSPAFKKMFITPEKLTEFQNGLLDANSVESIFFKKTEEYFSEVK